MNSISFTNYLTNFKIFSAKTIVARFQKISQINKKKFNCINNLSPQKIIQNYSKNSDSFQEFDREIVRAIAKYRDNSRCHTLCYIDIDRFKKIVDIWGSNGAKQLINQAIAILKQYFTSPDIVTYLGKNRIGLLWLNCSLTAAQKQAKILQTIIESSSFHWEKDELLGLSVSISLIALDDRLNN